MLLLLLLLLAGVVGCGVQFALLQNRQVAENKRLRAELDHYQAQLKKLQVRGWG